LNHLWLSLFIKILGWYLVSHVYKSSNDFCGVFIVLCTTFWLFVSYNASISMYFATLCKIIHTIVTLEKLLGASFFGGYISHPTCHKTILLASSCRFGLLSIVRIATFAFLGCWALGVHLSFISNRMITLFFWIQ